MAIKTPDILPGEPGWKELQEKKQQQKEQKKASLKSGRKAPTTVGKIELGSKAFRYGRAHQNVKGEKKLFIWRFKRKIAEVYIYDGGSDNESVTLKFLRLGGIGNHKHLIQDADFQLKWMTREQELLMTQKECYLCKKKISKSAQPNLYHYNLFKKRTKLLEKAEKVPEEVVSGKLTVEEGWEKFNQTLEDGNRYYMSLEETALICATCAKSKGLR
jgi:hypothetical protein